MKEMDRKRIVAWVVSSVMPHEPAVRRWLRSRLQTADDIDDLIQEAYAKLAALTSIDHIQRADTFFYRTVHNLLVDRIRHDRVVRIEAATETDLSTVYTEEPSPERIAGARQELSRVATLIDDLPERCRRIFTMRKIEGVSQREIASRLGVSESVVENEGIRGLRLILKALREDDAAPTHRRKGWNGISANRERY